VAVRERIEKYIIERLPTWKNIKHLSNIIKRQSTPNKVIRLWIVSMDFLLRLPLKIRLKRKQSIFKYQE